MCSALLDGNTALTLNCMPSVYGEKICQLFVTCYQPDLSMTFTHERAVIFMVCPKSNENDSFAQRRRARKGQLGGRGRWRGNPGMQFDLPQLSLRLCSSRYVSKVHSNFCVLSRAKMQRSLEQRYVIEFCAKLGKSGSETLQLFRTAYGDAVLSSAQVFRWHKALKDGRENVDDKQRAGRPSTARTENNVARVKAVLDRDRRLNVRLIAEEVGLPKMDVH